MEAPRQIITYAQNREDIILNAYFKDIEKGTYVDIGAHHPTDDSVTKLFYEKGWRGINVEPNEELYNLLVKERPGDINVQSGISDKPGTLKLRVYANSGLSTFSTTIKESYQHHPSEKVNDYKDVEVETLTLSQLLHQHPLEHIHFMKIDVEGYEYEVLSGNDWSKYRPEMVCIEADHQIKDWRGIFSKNRYRLVWNDGLNNYYLAEESAWREKNFDYPTVMLLEGQATPHHVFDKISSLQTEVDKQGLRNKLLELHVAHLEGECWRRDLIIRDQQRVSGAFKLLLIGLDRAIQARIDSLQAPENFGKIRQKRYITGPLQDQNPKKLLVALRKSDLDNFYNLKVAGPRKLSFSKRLMYFFVGGTYRLIKKPAVSLIRTVAR